MSPYRGKYPSKIKSVWGRASITQPKLRSDYFIQTFDGSVFRVTPIMGKLPALGSLVEGWPNAKKCEGEVRKLPSAH